MSTVLDNWLELSNKTLGNIQAFNELFMQITTKSSKQYFEIMTDSVEKSIEAAKTLVACRTPEEAVKTSVQAGNTASQVFQKIFATMSQVSAEVLRALEETFSKATKAAAAVTAVSRKGAA